MNRNKGEFKRDDKALGAFFAGMRTAHNISQNALADRLLNGRAISKLEQCGILPDALVFDALIRRLGASAQFFMTMLTERSTNICAGKKIFSKKSRWAASGRLIWNRIWQMRGT